MKIAKLQLNQENLALTLGQMHCKIFP